MGKRKSGYQRQLERAAFLERASDQSAAAQRAEVIRSRGGEPVAPRPSHALPVPPMQALWRVAVDYTPGSQGEALRYGEEVRVLGRDASSQWLYGMKGNAVDARWIPQVYLDDLKASARSSENDQRKRDASGAGLTQPSRQARPIPELSTASAAPAIPDVIDTNADLDLGDEYGRQDAEQVMPVCLQEQADAHNNCQQEQVDTSKRKPSNAT